jgi:hypothetical protein
MGVNVHRRMPVQERRAIGFLGVGELQPVVAAPGVEDLLGCDRPGREARAEAGQRTPPRDQATVSRIDRRVPTRVSISCGVMISGGESAMVSPV